MVSLACEMSVGQNVLILFKNMSARDSFIYLWFHFLPVNTDILFEFTLMMRLAVMHLYSLHYLHYFTFIIGSQTVESHLHCDVHMLWYFAEIT